MCDVRTLTVASSGVPSSRTISERGRRRSIRVHARGSGRPTREIRPAVSAERVNTWPCGADARLDRKAKVKGGLFCILLISLESAGAAG